jgi:hypothetical protein
VTAEDGSTVDYTATVAVATSNNKQMTAFGFVSPAVSGAITESTRTITVSMPFGTSATALVATFIHTGANVLVGSKIQVSGTTANNFSNPVVYRVRAADSSFTDYTVIVTVAAPSPAKAITTYSIASPAAVGVINESAKTIAVTVPYGTDRAALVATFTITGVSITIGGVNQVAGTTPNDFTNPVAYTVTAQDSTTVSYTVTVTVASSSAKQITTFGFSSPAVSGAINEAAKTIAVTVPFGTNSTALVATFTTTGASVTVGGVNQFSGTTPNNFTNPVVYTAIAQDSSTVNYTVTVTIAPASTDAYLSALSTSGGAFNETFAPYTTSYTQTVANAVLSVTVNATVEEAHATLTVNGTPAASGSDYGPISLSVGNTVITVVVTAQDGIATNTYTITIARMGSSDANLSALTISSGAFNEAFISSTTAYTQTVLGTVSGATVSPTASEIHATITVNGMAVASGNPSGTINFIDGSNLITIIVTAQDSTTKTYTITVTRRVNGTITLNISGASAQDGKTLYVADLSALGGGFALISSGSASIPFGYTYTGGNTYFVGAYIDADNDAATTGYAPDAGDYYLTTSVTVDGNMTVNVVYPGDFSQMALSNDAALSNLTLTGPTTQLNPVFSSGTNSYTAQIGHNVSSITVTPTAHQHNATITVNGTPNVSAGSTAVPGLVDGDNAISVVVTAQNGATNIYTITLTRGPWDAGAYDLFGTMGSVPAGSISNNTDTAVTLTATGGNVNGSDRRFYFVSKLITGDFTFTARIVSITGSFSYTGNNAYRYGLMFCENLNTVTQWIDSGRFVENAFYTASTAPTFMGSRAYKLDVGALSAMNRTDITTDNVGYYLRLVRSGSAFSIWTSPDNAAWTLAYSGGFGDANGNPISNTMYVGFFAAPGNESLTITYDSITLP